MESKTSSARDACPRNSVVWVWAWVWGSPPAQASEGCRTSEQEEMHLKRGTGFPLPRQDPECTPARGYTQGPLLRLRCKTPER